MLAGTASSQSWSTRQRQKAFTRKTLDQWFASSKTCHCCGYKMPEMPLHKRIWRCPECGAEHDRDINAALNIRQKGILELKAAGLVVSAHGGQRKSVAQTVAA